MLAWLLTMTSLVMTLYNLIIYNFVPPLRNFFCWQSFFFFIFIFKLDSFFYNNLEIFQVTIGVLDLLELESWCCFQFALFCSKCCTKSFIKIWSTLTGAIWVLFHNSVKLPRTDFSEPNIPLTLSNLAIFDCLQKCSFNLAVFEENLLFNKLLE